MAKQLRNRSTKARGREERHIKSSWPDRYRPHIVPSREFVQVPHHPEHLDEGVLATCCSALSHCSLLPLCCVARTPRTPHAALALLLLVPRALRHQTPRTNDDARRRRRKDAACPHGHKAEEDADRWSKRKLGSRPGDGAPLRARAPSFSLPCERGSNSHTDVVTRPRLSLTLFKLLTCHFGHFG